MTARSRLADVAVVGAGVVGMTSAWRLARSGRRVVLVDPEPGRGSTWAAAGMLAPANEIQFTDRSKVDLLVAAAERWPDFVEELEAAAHAEVGYRAEGTLVVGVDRSDAAALDEVVAFRSALGLDVEPLDAAACRRLEPALAPGIARGALAAGDHQVDNRRLVETLRTGLEAAGVEHVAELVEAVRPGRGGIHQLVGPSGVTAAARTVVLAPGAWWGSISCPGLEPPPVRPVHGATLRLRARSATPLPERTVRGLVHGRSCYLVPREDRSLVVGATMEEQGFEIAARSGVVHDLLRDARAVIPAIDDYSLEEVAPGFRPATPDGGPVVGWAGPEGVLVATGHFRNGILLAPLTADAVLAYVEGRPPPRTLARYTPDRFSGTGRDLGGNGAAR